MKVLISAGPTREKIDPIRFISNRSSGKMGYALAEAALKAGNEVILVSGVVNIPPPDGVKLICIESAKEMSRQMKKYAKIADIIIMAAAVADYRPKHISKQKIKKGADKLIIELEKTEDILSSLAKTKRKEQILVGFAAETQNLIQNAKKKLLAKNLDFIIANDVSRNDIAFDNDYNEVFILSKNGHSIKIPRKSKKEIAQKIIKIISANFAKKSFCS
ncbi:MAG TPA: bifunctional phosphopantothenoylcysteine decarboxylase/phosphopantothenate--cysteine ligase CoaBC [Victivallales bacterium]|nr:bifunctional phosphopantothenoylcysteine decarboxylase/phosphopantothenate--cysteine ligase CoaBC [Victivallales bacterium]HPO90146.1 bifunctional phosphopantothenoylcysteine decarboxylase/phosphopantothenate--cysteine ligase CoaBC [Victivallales bacterium]HRR28774.1 bifunctional phosphopantothenoylcysteine decarboxylase/phosphopantothenate--cysteine ligase CoaBC [Victivallales bacterium]